MNQPQLQLVVIYSPNPETICAFYERLGMRFARERHGRGPEHFAAQLGELVFEIYPLPADDSPANSVRLGFAVAALDKLLETLLDAGGKLITEPLDSPWGRRAVMADPEGRRLELVEARGPKHCCG